MFLAIKPAEQSVVEERKQICQKCDNFSTWVCKQCGCLLEAKIKLEVAKCPINKW